MKNQSNISQATNVGANESPTFEDKKELVSAVLDRFEEIYPDVECTLDYSTPLELLIAVQLSAQCTDARVNIVTKELFAHYRTVDDYADADFDELCERIRSVGFFRNKAKNIIACCRRLRDVYGGVIPDNMDDLLTLAGTGRKTANLILGDLFGKPAIVTDTHCIRISNRLGLTDTKDPVKTERQLKEIIPPAQGAHFCHQLVAHGRAICTARKPKCDDCALNDICKYSTEQSKEKGENTETR